MIFHYLFQSFLQTKTLIRSLEITVAPVYHGCKKKRLCLLLAVVPDQTRLERRAACRPGQVPAASEEPAHGAAIGSCGGSCPEGSYFPKCLPCM